VQAILKDNDPYTQPSFSLGHRLARLAWSLVYAALFRPSPVPFHEWRSFLLRRFGARIGRGCHVYPGARVWAPWNLSMGECSSMADGVNCYSMAEVSLGERAVVSQGAFLCTGAHDYEDPKFRVYSKPIKIGARAWVCAEAFLCPGVSVGEGAVIGARSVVTRDMPAWNVCAGSPCRPIKKRVVRNA